MKKILFYTANGIGLGHLRRTQLIAEELKKEKVEVILATSSLSPQVLGKFFDNFVKIGPLSDKLLENPQKTLKTRLNNGKIFLNALKKNKPDLIVADFHLNSSFTFYPLGYGLDNFPVQTVFVWRLGAPKEVIRDIKKEKEKLNYFKKIIIPHSLYELKDLYPFSFLKEIMLDSRFEICNPIFNKIDKDKINECRLKYNILNKDFFIVLASGGGGKLIRGNCEESSKIIDNFLEIFPKLNKKIPNLKVVIIEGPYSKKINKKFNNKIKFVRFEENFLELINLSDLVISAAGYNTCNELIVNKKPSILFPLKRGGNEQIVRANYFEKKGVARVVRGDFQQSFLNNIFYVKSHLKEMKKNFKNFSDWEYGNKKATKIIWSIL